VYVGLHKYIGLHIYKYVGKHKYTGLCMLSANICRLNLGPARILIQQGTEYPLLGSNSQSLKPRTLLHLRPRLRVTGELIPFPYTVMTFRLGTGAVFMILPTFRQNYVLYGGLKINNDEP
jgi:hypothetical protein